MKRRELVMATVQTVRRSYATLSYIGVAAIALVTLYFIMGAPSLEDILLAVLMLVFWSDHEHSR